MKTKIIFFVLTLLTLLFISPNKLLADDTKNLKLGNIVDTARVSDYRAQALQSFLETKNSPLAPYASYMVEKADQYSIPWDLLAGISGTESTFATAQPTNCNNSWGFGIYGNQTRCFNTYYDAIDTISKSIRDDYIDKWGCHYVDDIGRLYAASPTWAMHTKGFMSEIEDFANNYQIYSIPINM